MSVDLYDVDQTLQNPAPMGPGPNAQSLPNVDRERTSQPDKNSDMQTASDNMTLMQRSLNHSVTLVIWYKPANEPLRLTHEISTFPLFRLASLPAMLTDLELSDTSYVDAYNPQTGTWEQHTVSTVRVVHSEQRLLYKLRRSLLSGLADSECPGVEAELALQQPRKPLPLPVLNQPTSNLSVGEVSQGSLKRAVPDSQRQDAPEAKRMLLPEGFAAAHPMYMAQMNYLVPSQPIPYPHLLSNPTVADSVTHHPAPPNVLAHSVHHMPYGASALSASQGVPRGGALYPTPTTHTPSPSASTHPHGQSHTHDSPNVNASSNVLDASGGKRPHPPQKRWPNDYTVSELSAGLTRVDALVGTSGSMTQRLAFERVFGCRYVKSTVCRHRGLWRRADPVVKKRFEEMGSDERAIWGEFVRTVEGRAAGKDALPGEDMGEGEESGTGAGAGGDNGEEGNAGEGDEEKAAEQDPRGEAIPHICEAAKPISSPQDQRLIPGSGDAQAIVTETTEPPPDDGIHNGHIPVYDPALSNPPSLNAESAPVAP